jgi:hypothetical protein
MQRLYSLSGMQRLYNLFGMQRFYNPYHRQRLCNRHEIYWNRDLTSSRKFCNMAYR